MDVQEFIAFCLQKIIVFFQPEKVYMFGSQARGDATEDSDVDFLVVTPSGESKRNRSLKFRHLLRGNYWYPVDIVVYTSAELENEKNIKGTIAYSAVKEGTLLYGSQPSKNS